MAGSGNRATSAPLMISDTAPIPADALQNARIPRMSNLDSILPTLSTFPPHSAIYEHSGYGAGTTYCRLHANRISRVSVAVAVHTETTRATSNYARATPALLPNTAAQPGVLFNFRDRVFHPEDLQRLREERQKGLLARFRSKTSSAPLARMVNIGGS
jgi:hypothetical protein